MALAVLSPSRLSRRGLRSPTYQSPLSPTPANHGLDARGAAINTIREAAADITIYTDGAASGGNRDGSHAAVFTSGDPWEPFVLGTARRSGRQLTTPLEEELDGIRLAIDNVGAYLQAGTALICTDSKAAAVCIKQGSANTVDLRAAAAASGVNFNIQWVPAHCGVPGNEAADLAAKGVPFGGQQPISFDASKAFIKASICDPPSTKQRVLAVYGLRGLVLNSEAEFSRSDSVLISQLRSGHCHLLAAYKNIISSTTDPTCPLCGVSPQTVEHWLLECEAIAAERSEVFGTMALNLACLRTLPRQVVLFARATLCRA